MIYLKASTASQEVPLGYFVDSTNGNDEESGLTIANTDIKLWKAGATSVANKNSGGATHMSNGLYYAVLDATDTNTVGPLTIFVHVSGALPVKQDCTVLPANVYDSLIAGSDLLDISLVQISGDAQSATDLKDFADAGYDPSTNKVQGLVLADAVTTVNGLAANTVTASALATDAVTEIQSGLATATALTTVDTVVDAIQAVTDLIPDAGAMTSIAQASALATVDTVVDTIAAAVDTEVAAIKAKTDQLTFTVSNQLDANMQSINDVALTGDGQPGTEFSV